MVIDRDIVRRCTEEARNFRALSRESSMVSGPRTPPPSSKGCRKMFPKALRPRPVKSLEIESGYGTDTDRSDDYLYSPSASSGSAWTALNTPRSVGSQHYRSLTLDQLTIAYKGPQKAASRLQEAQSTDQRVSKKRLRSDNEVDEDGYEGDSSWSRSSLGTPMPDMTQKQSPGLSQETRAAYQLMQLKMDDAALVGDRSRRRRAST